MLFRSASTVLNLISALLFLVLVLLAFTAWRLAQEPVSIEFLEPYLEDALSNANEDIEVEVGDTYLAWSGSASRLGVRARDWQIYDDQGRLLASFPSADVVFSLTELLHGRIAPVEIDIMNATVNLIRDEDGEFRLGSLGEDTGREEDFAEVAERVLGHMLGEQRGDQPWSYLQKLHVSNSEVRLEDRQLDTVLSAENSDIDLWTEPSGIAGQAELELRIGDQLTPLIADFRYGKDSDFIAMNVTVDRFDPTAAASAFPGSGFLPSLQFVLAGRIQADVPLSGELPEGSFTLNAPEGRIVLPDHFRQPVAFKDASLEGSFSASGKRRLSLSDGSLTVLTPDQEAGPRIRISSELEEAEEGYRVGVDAEVRRVLAKELSDFWPRTTAENAREWVTENIRDGRVNLLKAQAAVAIGEAGEAELLELTGGFDYEGLEVHYLEPLPPAVDTVGTASFNPDGLDFVLAGGRVNGIEVTEGLLDIHGLSGEDHRLDMTFQANGRLPDAFEILEHPRLALLQEMGFTASGSEGRFNAELNFAFPLLDDLEFEQVELSTVGQLEDVLIEDAFLEEDMRGGPLDIRVTQDEMRVQGPMQLGTAQGTADWREVFAGQGVRTRVQAEIPRLEQEDWEIVDFDPAPYLSGAVSAGLTARIYADGRAEVEARGNLQGAELHIPELDWQKPPTESGEITASLVLQGESFLGLEDFELTTAELRAAGVVTMDESGQDIQEAALSEFVLGRSNLKDVVVRTPPEGPIEVVLGSGQLDLLPLIEESSREDSVAAADDTAPENDEEAVSPDLVVRTPGLSRVYFSEDRYFEDLSLEAERRDGTWMFARGQAELSGGRQSVAGGEESSDVPIPEGLRLTYGPQESGEYALDLTASDMGALLQAMGLTEGIRGGAMRISGKSEGPYPEEPMNVRLWSQDFRLVNAPAMAQLLTVASLTGIADLMSGEGIGFQRLHGEAIIYESQITSDLIQANGPALGITARGRLDMEGDDTDIRGTLVPAYSVNSILGSIPLLGDLLIGGEGEGILGVSYVVTGSMDDPDIAVNPLSFLAPGFLRQLFNIAPDTSPPETSQEPEVEQAPEESPDPSANPGRLPSMGR